MKNLLLIVLCFFYFVNIQAQNDILWNKKTNNFSTTSAINNINSDLIFSLNEKAFKNKLMTTLNSNKKTKKTSSITISIPNINGKLETFKVWESSNFEPKLQEKYPNIRAYEGLGLTDKKAKIYFSISPLGIQTMVLRDKGNSEFIEKTARNTAEYKVFSPKKNNLKSALKCYTNNEIKTQNLVEKLAKTKSNNHIFRTLKLALSCTGEYTSYFGGTKAGALAGINATLTRVNGVFNRDLALKLVLIANNDNLIYTNANTDPYSSASIGVEGKWSQELQTNLTNTIGNANYDIGHLFGASGGGGNAGCIGCICDAPTFAEPLAKGSGYTSPADKKPEGDAFDIDFVSHELGHQLGANHTFSYSIENTGVSVEPGSGSTIMGYAGVTDNYDIQDNSDGYFAYASILQIQNNLAYKSCPVTTIIQNNPPVVDAGLDYTIPFGTAFVLKGKNLDTDEDTLSYCWEQYDSAITTFAGNSLAITTKEDGPLFRSFSPVSSPTRYMPSLDNVLKNQLTSPWESVSAIARTLHFTLTVRDNATLGIAQTNTDQMIVNVSGTEGPFVVTSQNKEDITWHNEQKKEITWDVNNTNILAGSANVNIKLSTDGGLTFPITLAENTQNDGSEEIVVPFVEATDCRILVEPTDNIFYAINSQKFTITTENAKTLDFAIFPNPNNGYFTIKFEALSNEPIQVFVYDILGKNIYKDIFETGSSVLFEQEIQLENIQAGIYFLKVINGDRKTVKKIVIK